MNATATSTTNNNNTSHSAMNFFNHHNNNTANEQNLVLSPFDIDFNDHIFDSPILGTHNHHPSPQQHQQQQQQQLSTPVLLTPKSHSMDNLFLQEHVLPYYHQHDNHDNGYAAASVSAVMAANLHHSPTTTTTTATTTDTGTHYHHHHHHHHHHQDENDILSLYLSSTNGEEDAMSSSHMTATTTMTHPRWHHIDPPPLPQLMETPTASVQTLDYPTTNATDTTESSLVRSTSSSRLPKLQVETQFNQGEMAKRIPSSSSLSSSSSSSLTKQETKQQQETTTTMAPAPTTTTTTATTTATTTTTMAVEPEEEEEQESANRGWQTVFVDAQYHDMIHVDLTSKTRCEEPCAQVPSKMYSSLKYEIRHHASGALCDQVAFLLARITVVDSVNFEEIKKDNRPVLKGVVESALTKPSGSAAATKQKLYGVLKCQFTDVSYHHKKRDFCWQIGLFRPEELENPIMIMRSAPYKVFARKPATNKKRRRETTSENAAVDAATTVVTSTTNTATTTATTTTTTSVPLTATSTLAQNIHNNHNNNNNNGGWEQFQDRLDDLFRDAKRMKMDDKKKVVNLLCEKMMSLDGNLFSQTVIQLQQHFVHGDNNASTGSQN